MVCVAAARHCRRRNEPGDFQLCCQLQSTYVSDNAFGDPLIPYDPFGVGNTASGGYWGSGRSVSVVFQKPAYQFLVNTGAAMRSIPDISMQMGGCPLGIAAK
jgi:hypothetical protein